jgi:nicotinate-nucleotide adenylyltransferase
MMAQIAFDELRLDKIIFVPVHFPPHKSRRGVIDARHRLNMVRLAIKGNFRFSVSDFEVRKNGKSYSIDTLEYFHKRFPSKTKFYFIIGEDMLTGLKRWKRIADIRKLAAFAVVRRPGYPGKRKGVLCRYVEMPAIGISSSGLRRRIRHGKTIKYLVPGNVEQYIKKQRLFQTV